MIKKRRKGISDRDELVYLILLVLIVSSLILGITIGRNSTLKKEKTSQDNGLQLLTASTSDTDIQDVIQKAENLYTLQVSSLKKRENAEDLVAQLRLRGYVNTEINEYVTSKGQTWYRVDVGQYISKSAARSVGEELKSKGLIKNYIIRKIK